MNLHHVGHKPDWQHEPSISRNRWQRLAASTHGIITPGNALSTVGLVLTALGLFVMWQQMVLPGIAILLVGRLMDALDGYAADLTRTKSPLGQLVDAGFDKLAAFATLAVIALIGILPGWLAALIALQNTANVALTLIGRQRSIVIQPSRSGKLATGGYWIGIGLFTAVYLSGQEQAVLFGGLIGELAYAVIVASLILGMQATIGYARRALHFETGKFDALDLFDHYIVIQNPASTDARKTSERVRELQRLRADSGLTILNTLPGGRAANDHLLEQCRDQLGSRTLLCIAAGDGTVNLMLNSLLHNPKLSAKARATPIVPLWCGNANDLAYMLNGRPSRHPVKKILRRGHIVSIRPLSCKLKLADGTIKTFTAACYASFGASAFATQEMEQSLRSKSPIRRFGLSRLGQEFIATMWALMRAPTFKVSEHDGQTHVIFERTHLNGSRFAKVIGLPLRLTDSKFHRATIVHRHLPLVLLHIIGLVSDRNLSKKTITRDAFTVHDPVWAQFDGEAVRIPAGTHIEITVSKQSFSALTVRTSRP